jgi:putative transposase
MLSASTRTGLTPEDRELVYAQTRLPESQARKIELMVESSGFRKVGCGALTNVRAHLNSVKNAATRTVESHTCELLFAYELEMDPTVLGYYSQVPCAGVRRTTAMGRLHVSDATIDFLVFRHAAIHLVECKTSTWLQRERRSKERDWYVEGGGWRHRAYECWAAERGLEFHVWVPPTPSGVYQRNLELCYALLEDEPDRPSRDCIRGALKLISVRPQTLSDLTKQVPGFTGRLAAHLLAKRRVYGPWKSTPLERSNDFILYADAERAACLDEQRLTSIRDEQRQPVLVDRSLLASMTDIRKAKQRLARLASIAAGSEPQTRRMTALARKVAVAVQRGEPALSACLTRYANSGNRGTRLTSDQQALVEETLTSYWNTGRAKTPGDLYNAYLCAAEDSGIEPVSRTALNRRRRQISPERHALATGGFRAFHSVRTATDPRYRSLPPVGYGQVLHIDSSDLDVRLAPDLARLFPATKVKFYVGVDGATGDSMSHAVIFGAPRTDGLALLIREYVHRHRMLPRIIHVDRGPENTSIWLLTFCEGRIILRHSPTGGCPWNSPAETGIKQVNLQVANRLTGSTAPDQKGRSVDGRFKSRHHAKVGFEEAMQHFLEYFYGDRPRERDNSGASAIDRRDAALSAYGPLGTSCKWGEDILIQTAIPVQVSARIDYRRGIRTSEGYFQSEELAALLRTSRPDEVRSDVCNPAIVYAKFGASWVKGFHSRIQTLAAMTDTERLFDLMWSPIARSDARETRHMLSHGRFKRIIHAERIRSATAHLAPLFDIPDQESAPIQREPLASHATPPPSTVQPYGEVDE